MLPIYYIVLGVRNEALHMQDASGDCATLLKYNLYYIYADYLKIPSDAPLLLRRVTHDSFPHC
jgi:hypothetical protein